MNLKNYTSETPADRSISKIERKLVEMGARNINKEYKDQILSGIKFLIDIKGNTIVFSLPAKVETVFKVLWDQVKRPQPGTKERVRQQAERTAWKIISDWVDVQASMVYLEQAEVLQVFLPYALVNSDQTVYEIIMDKGFKALLPKKDS